MEITTYTLVLTFQDFIETYDKCVEECYNRVQQIRIGKIKILLTEHLKIFRDTLCCVLYKFK